MSRNPVATTAAAVAAACLFAGPVVAQESSAEPAEQSAAIVTTAGAPILSSSVALRTASGAESPSLRAASTVDGNLTVATPSVRSVEEVDLYRDPSMALRRGLYYPGGGYFYTGEKTKGAIALGGAIGSVILGLALSGDKDGEDEAGFPDFMLASGGNVAFASSSSGNCRYNMNTHTMVCKKNRTPMYVGFAGAGLIWMGTAFHSRGSANKANKKNGCEPREYYDDGRVKPCYIRAALQLSPPQPVITVDSDSRPEVGVRMQLTW